MDASSSGSLTTSQGDIDLRGFLGLIHARRWWIVLSAAAFTALFTAAAFLMTPVYRSATVLVDASADRDGLGSMAPMLGQLGGLASLAGINLGSGGSNIEEALAVLRSREFTEAFIREHDLLPVLFAKQWDAATGRWKNEHESEWPTLVDGYKLFERSVRTVSQDRRTGLVTLEIEWTDPVLAAEWANLLVARLNAEMRSRAIENTKASVGFLERELATTSVVETRAALNRLIEAQINRRMLAAVTQEYVFRVADRALPSDWDDPVRPNRLAFIVLGPPVGAIVGVFAVLAAGLWASARRV